MKRALDSYHGRMLEGLKTSKDGTWQLKLEGDIIITNHDKELKAPHIDKKKFGKLIFATTIMDYERTQMVFHEADGSEWRVMFNPLLYTISNPEEDDEEWFPQHGNLVQEELPPHPDERVAEGPTVNEDEEEEE